MMKVILSIHDEVYSEHTRWRLFWAYMMKVILSIHDEVYSEHTWWSLFWAYMKAILSIHEGYSEHTWWSLFWAYMMKVILSIHDEGYSEHTWWRLFQKNFVRTKLDIYVCITITLPISMFVLLSPFRYLCLYYYHPSDIYAGEHYVPEGIIRPVVSSS